MRRGREHQARRSKSAGSRCCSRNRCGGGNFSGRSGDWHFCRRDGSCRSFLCGDWFGNRREGRLGCGLFRAGECGCRLGLRCRGLRGRYGFRECGDGSGCFRLRRGCGAVWSGAEHGRIFDVVVAVCCGDRERLPALRAESCGAGQRGAAVRTYHNKPLSWFALPSLLYSRHVIFSSLFAVFGRGI